MIPSVELARRLLPRVLRKVEPEPMSGCWLWTGTVSAAGYGVVTVGRHMTRPTHRVVWAALVAPLTKGLHLDHKCRVRCCCNPAHLREVTARENILAEGSLATGAANYRKTHCIHGHPLSIGNLAPSRPGWRVCLVCKRASDRRQTVRDLHRRQAKRLEGE